MMESSPTDTPRPPVDVQRVLLADDHALFREGVARLLAYEDDFEVVGEAADGVAALQAARELMPDLVLMDVDMPGLNGIEATRQLTGELPYVRVVMLTVHEDDDTLFQAIRGGAQGYLVKSIRTSEMLDQLRGLSRGEAPLSRAMASRILAEFARTTASGAALQSHSAARIPGHDAADGAGREGAPEERLTAREVEVLELVTRRYSNKEIASQLIITEYTVKNHLRNILSKLHLKSRTEAARYALRHGLAAQEQAGYSGVSPRRSAPGIPGAPRGTAR